MTFDSGLIDDMLKYSGTPKVGAQMNIVTMVEKIKKDPGLYLRTMSVSEVRDFLGGFEHALWRSTVIQSFSMSQFRDWLSKMCKRPLLSFPWDHYINLPHKTNSEALNHFFEQWAVFVAGHPTPAEFDPVVVAKNSPSLSAFLDELADKNQFAPEFPKLVAFLSGYQVCRGGTPIELPGNDPLFNRFIDWTVERYGLGNEYSWVNLFFFFTMDSSRLLNEFFQSWNDFRAFENLMEEIDRSENDKELLLRAADICKKFNSSKGVAIYDKLLALNMIPPNEIADVLYWRAVLKKHALDDTTDALRDFRKALEHHLLFKDENDPMWRALRNGIVDSIEELTEPSSLSH